MPTTSDLIAYLAAAFPQRPISDKTRTVYVRQLADIDTADLADAVNVLARTSEFFPTIYAIRSAVAEAKLQLPSETEALAAVDDPHRRARLHPLVREALEAVGGSHAWRSTSEPGVLRGQFLRIYKDLRHARVGEAIVGDISLGSGPPLRELSA